ncbi:NAD(P)-dependent alcohol dehydrogenase [Nonomuraea sp. NPDC050556]|uniref:NAD(P)-dependent alcohol dehydrogenase n=1 Tax=Nonomuraea sp. NPDC050556 TaxID=3364369 RepID=UPI0037B09AD2
MRAIVQDAYGEAGDVLRLAEIDRPSIKDDEVLVRVRAAGVDRGVWHLMAGEPYPVRLAIGVRRPRSRVRGREVAGVVEAVGAKAVAGFAPGDEVYGIAEGTFAEFAPAKATKLAPKPKNLTFEQAAAAPISALTALQGVRDTGQVKAGHKVLVIGASGGVGTFAVQIAKSYGAEVTGVCGTAKTDLVEAMGADHVIDYTRQELTGRYDVIVDTGGNRTLTSLRRLLTPRGTLVIVGAETGGRWFGGLGRLVKAPFLSPFVSQRLRPFVSSENARDLVALAELIESGAVTPAVERAFPLEEAAAAVQHMKDGLARGKVVVVV